MDQETKQQFDQLNEKMDERFKRVDEKFEEMLLTVKEGFDEVTGRLDTVEGDIKILKSTSVTKDYLDDKLADLGAEIGRRIQLISQREKSFHLKMIELLKKSNALSPEHAAELEEMLI